MSCPAIRLAPPAHPPSLLQHHTVEELQHYQSLLERMDARGLMPEEGAEGVAPATAGAVEEGEEGEGECGPGGQLKGHAAAQKLLEDCYGEYCWGHCHCRRPLRCCPLLLFCVSAHLSIASALSSDGRQSVTDRALCII